MILERARHCLMIFAVIGAASPAQADVLEMGDEGPRWIAGGSAVSGTEISTNQPTEIVELSAEFDVPVNVASDPSVHAAVIPDSYEAKVLELSQRFDLSPALIEALVWQESRWRENARSPVGARGLAQLMPATARELGVDPDDPFANLEGGARYLRAQLDRFDGDIEKALAAYNAGPGRVEAARGIPNIRETRKYVAAVMGRLSDHSRR